MTPRKKDRRKTPRAKRCRRCGPVIGWVETQVIVLTYGEVGRELVRCDCNPPEEKAS